MNRFALATATALALFSTAPAIASSPARGAAVRLAQSVLSSGEFKGVEHPTEGTARIVEENGRRYLELGRDFRTDSGPDLTVVLHRSAMPGLNFEEGDYLVLDELAAFNGRNGEQRYDIPGNVDLSDYRSAAIWCRAFNATFGAAALR